MEQLLSQLNIQPTTAIIFVLAIIGITEFAKGILDGIEAVQDNGVKWYTAFRTSLVTLAAGIIGAIIGAVYPDMSALVGAVLGFVAAGSYALGSTTFNFKPKEES